MLLVWKEDFIPAENVRIGTNLLKTDLSVLQKNQLNERAIITVKKSGRTSSIGFQGCAAELWSIEAVMNKNYHILWYIVYIYP